MSVWSVMWEHVRVNAKVVFSVTAIYRYSM